MPRVDFTINYLAKNKEKFQQFLTKYSTTIEIPLINLKVEQYWKIPDQLQATFYIQLPKTDIYQTTYRVLQLANQLHPTRSASWTINGPYENGHFECILNNEGEHPVKWAHLSLEF